MLIFGYWVKTILAGCCLAAPAGKDTENSGKLAIRPDHPRCRIKVNLCVVNVLRCVVKYKCYRPICQPTSKSVKGLRRCGGRAET